MRIDLFTDTLPTLFVAPQPAAPEPVRPTFAGRKILCMCQRGDSRSVALAWLLKGHLFGLDAVAIGWQTAGQQLKTLLFRWADHIVILEAYMIEHVPAEYRAKTTVFEVGPDVYFRGFDKGLTERLKGYIKDQWGVEPKHAD